MHLMRNLSRVGRDGCGVPSLVPSLWDRVVADLARKRMAPQQSLQAQPNPTRHAKALDRFVGILRAGGMKAAVPRKQNGQIGLVEPRAKREMCTGSDSGTEFSPSSSLWSFAIFCSLTSSPARRFRAAAANPP